MARSAAFRNFVVGLVFLGSLLALGVVTLLVSGLTIGGKVTMIPVYFDHVSGLREGDESRYRGHRVGQVERIETFFQPGRAAPGAAAGATAGAGRPIRVTIRVNDELPLTRDTQFLVKSRGPLGGNYVEIVPGTGDLRTAEAGFDGSATPDLFEEIGEVVRENRQGLKEAITQIGDTVKAINEREGALGALLKDPATRDRLTKAIENIEEISRAIREGQGTVGKLINDPKVYNDLEKITGAIAAGEGTFGKLVMESKIHDDLEDLIARARRIAADVEEGEGTLALLVKDKEFAQDVREAASEFRETIAKVNQGEGTAGQLVNNREAWDRLVFVLRQAQEAVEDFREQAPINTFVNAIFSGF